MVKLNQSKSLRSFIQDMLPDDADIEYNIVDIAEAIVLHVLSVDTAYTCQSKLKSSIDFERIGSSAQKFRLLLASMGYVHMNIKYMAFNMALNPINNENLTKYMKGFGVSRNDVVILKQVFNRGGFRRNLRKDPVIEKIDKSLITIEAFNRRFDVWLEIYPDIYRHIKHKTYNKLRFISVSSNIEFHDFHMDLMYKALQTYIKLCPTDKSVLHVANYVRSSLNNATVNMIKEYTAQKRKRMSKGKSDGFGGNEFEISVVSENQLFKALGMDTNQSYEDIQSHSVNNEEENKQYSSLQYLSVLRRYGNTPKRKVFLRLLAQEESANFTSYLIENSLIKEGQDNVYFGEHCSPGRYFSTVCRYLRVKKKSGRKFASYVGKHLRILN